VGGETRKSPRKKGTPDQCGPDRGSVKGGGPAQRRRILIDDLKIVQKNDSLGENSGKGGVGWVQGLTQALQGRGGGVARKGSTRQFGKCMYSLRVRLSRARGETVHNFLGLKGKIGKGQNEGGAKEKEEGEREEDLVGGGMLTGRFQRLRERCLGHL